RTSRHIVKIIGGFVVVTVITLVTLTAVRHKHTGAVTQSPKNAVVHNSNATKTGQQAGVHQPNTSTVANTVSNTKEDANHTITSPLSGSTRGSSTINKNVQGKDSALSLAANNKPDAMQLLNEFYSRIEKGGQVFTVKGNHDTTLVAAE